MPREKRIAAADAITTLAGAHVLLQRVDFYLIHKAPVNDLNTGSLLAPIKVDAL